MRHLFGTRLFFFAFSGFDFRRALFACVCRITSQTQFSCRAITRFARRALRRSSSATPTIRARRSAAALSVVRSVAPTAACRPAASFQSISLCAISSSAFDRSTQVAGVSAVARSPARCTALLATRFSATDAMNSSPVTAQHTTLLRR